MQPTKTIQFNYMHKPWQTVMWDHFLCHRNGVSFIAAARNTSPMVFSDASATTGFAAIFGTHWLAGTWPDEVRKIPGFMQTSALFELYPIVAAAHAWGHLWSYSIIVFISDNTATVDILLKGRSKCPHLMSLARRLVQLSLTYNFHYCCSHISGTQNVAADALSRANFSLFSQVMPEAHATGTAVPPFSNLFLD